MKFWWRRQTKRFSNLINFLKCKALDWSLKGGTKSVVTACAEFEFWDEALLIATWEFSDHQDSASGVKANEFSIGVSSTSVKLSAETLMDKIIAVVAEEGELD